jgi:HTH-type transcriptional regulator / antitoxin PezA
MNINDEYMLTLEQEILNEQAAQIMADITRFYIAAEEAGDETHRVIYEDILQQISHAKRQIIKQENREVTKLAKIREEIEALKGGKNE